MGYISVAQMQEAYGVVLNEQGALDGEATDVRRAALRHSRAEGDAV